MNIRIVSAGGGLILLLAAAGGGAWHFIPSTSGDIEGAAAAGEDLPIPPVPPRIAESPDYERCLTMLATDPAGAESFATAWQAKDGGTAAAHCLALSMIALGEPAHGAEMLERVASDGNVPRAARAVIYGQATQAWLMTGRAVDANRAAGLALALSADDPDLLVEGAVAAVAALHYQDAVDDLTRALALDGKRADAYTWRASAWRHLDRLDEAEADIERAVAIDPDNPEALLERGILRQRRDDRAGARTDWERTIVLAPDTAAADLAQQNLALLEAGPERE
jgi:tetratricopeptide (TPR) repeat protein